MLLDLLQSVCEELNKLAYAGWEIDHTHTTSAYLVRIKNGQGAIIEAFDGGGHITFSSTISYILTDNKSVTISATKTPAQIARDVKRRLLDGYTEAFIAAKKKEEEQRERADYIRAVAADIAARYGLSSCGGEFTNDGGKDITVRGYVDTPGVGCSLNLRKLTQAQVINILDIVMGQEGEPATD